MLTPLCSIRYLSRVCLTDTLGKVSSRNSKLSNSLLRNCGAIRFASTVTSQDKPESPAVVYVGPLSKQIRGIKLFSLLTSVTGICAQPVFLEQAKTLGHSTAVIIGVSSFVGFFTFVTPLLLHFITKKYVTSITYDPVTDKYVATTLSLFLRKRETKFGPGEAVIPEIPGMFTSIQVGSTPLFVDDRYFDDVSHYMRIMGYDKPMDFKLKSSPQK